MLQEEDYCNTDNFSDAEPINHLDDFDVIQAFEPCYDLGIAERNAIRLSELTSTQFEAKQISDGVFQAVEVKPESNHEEFSENSTNSDDKRTNFTAEEIEELKAECYSIETANHRATYLSVATGTPYKAKQVGDGVFQAVPENKVHRAVESALRDFDLLRHVGNDQLIKRLSKTLATGIQLPENDVFMIGLAIFSSVATRKYSVAYEHGGYIPIGLYVVAEQPPAAAKTWLQTEFQKPFDDIDDENRKQRKEELERLEKQLENCEEEDAREISKQIKELKKNPIPLLFITNTTPEALEMSLHNTNGLFSLVSSEQTLFDSLFGLIGGDKGKQNNNEIVLNGFDASKSGTLRVGRGAYSGRAAGGVALFAQNGSIEKLFNASGGTGLSERFLMLSSRHLLGKRKHLDAPQIDRTITAEYHKLASDLGLRALKPDCNVSDVTILNISKDGHRKIKQYRDFIEDRLADDGAYSVHESLRGTGGKANMQIMKIAANLHLLDGKAYENIIDDKHIDSAIKIVDDILNSMLGLCHDKELVGAKAEHSAIIGYLSGRKLKAGEISQGVRGKKPFRDMTCSKTDAIKEALSEMLELGLLLVDSSGFYSVG